MNRKQWLVLVLISAVAASSKTALRPIMYPAPPTTPHQDSLAWIKGVDRFWRNYEEAESRSQQEMSRSLAEMERQARQSTNKTLEAPTISINSTLLGPTIGGNVASSLTLSSDNLTLTFTDAAGENQTIAGVSHLIVSGIKYERYSFGGR